jgi:hypothetical protein
MIQRVQSLYLLLTAIISALLFYVPLFQYPLSATDTAPHMYFVSANAFLLILNIVVGALSFITIFFFKNRKLQLRACRLCLMLIFVMVGLLFYTSDALAGGIDQRVTFKAGAYLPLIQIVLVFLAHVGIKKDDKLVRSADRLR